MAWTKDQAKAINETGTNIIVSAGAGSGKTAVLTARTMRIIKSGIHVNELLILTFTKAAAAEMKSRIRDAIKEEIPEHPSLSKELELIDQAYITTFDSFALSIVKKYHYLLNISNNINISDSSIIAIQSTKIMDKIFDDYYANPSKEFSSLIYDFCVKDDKSLKEAILHIASRIDAMPNRDDYLKNYFNNYFTPEFIDKCLEEYEQILQEKLKEINNMSYKLSLLTDGDYGAKLTESLAELNTCQTITDFLNQINLVKLPNLPRGSEDEVKEAKSNLKDTIDSLKDIILNYGSKENIIASLSAIKTNVEVIVSIITDYLNELHNYKEQNEIYDFQDIALLSIKVLKENEIVRNELKNTFKEIMIDEYQDTNDIQETFISMIENHNVYMVGDIKQSIYRFRNANPYIFKTKYDTYSLGQNGIKIDLVKNFRSRKEVLSNINDVFNLIMDDIIGGAEYSKSHQMVFGNEDYIKEGLTDYNNDLEILEYEEPEDKKYSKEEIEIFAIAQDIKNKMSSHYQVFDKQTKRLRDITYNDFVILMDRSTSFDLYKKIFEYVGIPLTLFKEDKLNNSDDIYILKNIIDFIIKINQHQYDQEFKYDFISIARSYLFELSDEEIFEFFKNDNFKDNIIYETFKELSSEISSTSVTTLLEKIITKTNMYEKFIKIGNIDSGMIRISKLFDIASNLSNLGYDIYTFRDYLKELLSANIDMKYKSYDPKSKSVKIMTIHTSKGLEFPICYYSGLYCKFNISDIKDKFLFSNEYGIVTPYFKEGINESLIKFLIKYHYLEEEVSEKIRLFYVALTRAKEKMIILTPVSDEEIYDLAENKTIDLSIRRKYDRFSKFLNSIKHYLIKYYKPLDLSTINLTKEYLYTSKSLSKLTTTNPQEFVVEPIKVENTTTITQEHFSKNLHELITKDIKNNMEFGLLMHETLEYLDFKNPNYEAIENSFIKDKVSKFLSQPLLSNVSNANIYKEYEFIYNDETNEYHGIIDLMLEYDDKIDIIDYKLSNVNDPNYLKQLTGYKTYINTITNKPINIYLYSILNETLEQLK